MRLYLALWSLIFFLDFTNLWALDIPNYLQVTDKISRGGRPGRSDLQELYRSRYKLIINLENNVQAVNRENGWARDIGIEDVSLPMEWKTGPNDKQIDEILALLTDPSKMPVFIHCTHGQDRTGLLIGLYRVLVQKWDPKKAYDEMVALGFHPEFSALTDYFWKRVSANPL